MDKKYYLGIDVGGTKVEGAIAELDNSTHSIRVLSKKRIPCIQVVDQFIYSIAKLTHDLLIEANLNQNNLFAVGIGLPGTLDPETKIMLNGNTQFLIGVDILGLLKDKLQILIPIVAQNDANLFTLAEAWGGVGKSYYQSHAIEFEKQVALGITLGTGVGGGLVATGKILNGAHGSALEVGHISLDPKGNLCYCGQRGCAETYLSGTALNKMMDSKILFEKIKTNDEEALQILANYKNHLVHFLSILNNLFNPHYFVFGGGLSSQEIIFTGIKENLEKSIFLSKEYCPGIYLNQLGDSAGLFGAMIYANEIL